MQSHPILYKKDSAGKVRTWFMETCDDQHRTVAGIQNGKSVVSNWTTCTAKNVGRSNEVQPSAQALLEVQAQYGKKLDRDYFRSVHEVDVPRYFKPMLAQKYESVKYPVYSQPKLDGIRAIVDRHGMKSREGRPFVSCPHIMEALAPFFAEFPEAVLDGEIYNHDFKDDFNEIVSIVKQEKPSIFDLVWARRSAQYHVYDLPSAAHLPFGRRRIMLLDDLGIHSGGCIQLVPTVHVGNQALLDDIYAEYLDVGFEGQMVRLNAPYEQKRSKTLLKRKEFQDAEYDLVVIEEGLGNWSGVAKKIVARLPDGRTFGAGIKGTKAQAAKLLTEKHDKVTVRFFNLTPDGIPRFPVATHFYSGERI